MVEEDATFDLSKAYYTQFLKSLDSISFNPKQRRQSLRFDDDDRSPFRFMLHSKKPRPNTQYDSHAAEKEQRELKRLYFLCEKQAKDSALLCQGGKHVLKEGLPPKPSVLEKLVHHVISSIYCLFTFVCHIINLLFSYSCLFQEIGTRCTTTAARKPTSVSIPLAQGEDM
jgi:hypothetical protein